MGVGGVLVSLSKNFLEFFFEALNNDFVVSMGHGSTETIIFEVELLAI